MPLSGFTAALSKGIGALDRTTLALFGAGAAGSMLFLAIVGVSVFGDAEDGEPKQVLKIDFAANAGKGAHPAVEHATPVAATAAVAGSLIAVNGIVISDPALLETSSDGALPRVAADGRKPMDVYARPYDRTDPRPKVAVIVSGMGLGGAVTEAAIDRLPPGITLAFTPYGSELQAVVSTARAKGHEVLLEVPLEPYDYPDNDPGQNTLLTGTSSAENPARLHWVMSRFAGYAGLINTQGEKFLTAEEDTRYLMDEAKARGLYVAESGESEQSIAREMALAAGTSFARADFHIDQNPTREAIESELTALENLAKQRGAAVAYAGAFPVTIDRLSTWAAGLEEKGIALVPVSVVAQAIEAPAPVRTAAPAAKPHASPRPSSPAHDTQPVLPTNPEPAFETAPHP